MLRDLGAMADRLTEADAAALTEIDCGCGRWIGGVKVALADEGRQVRLFEARTFLN